MNVFKGWLWLKVLRLKTYEQKNLINKIKTF